MAVRPNFFNPKRFSHTITNTFKRGKDTMEAICVVKPIEKATSGIGAKGSVDRRLIESTRSDKRVLHATKGWRKV